jgi:hypothetical protein
MSLLKPEPEPDGVDLECGCRYVPVNDRWESVGWIVGCLHHDRWSGELDWVVLEGDKPSEATLTRHAGSGSAVDGGPEPRTSPDRSDAEQTERGTSRDVKRVELLEEMRRAGTPDEIATALFAAREWMQAHPKDDDVQLAVAELLRVERNVLPAAS